MDRVLCIGLVLALALLVASGCSTRTTTVTVTETVEAPEGATDEGETRVVVHEETTVEREFEPSCHGVLSCSFMVAGEAIALPFKVVGAAFRVIF